MKAIAYRQPGSVATPGIFEEIIASDPILGPRDILVRVSAVSVNPVDTKVRARAVPPDGYRILGFDAAGVVEAVGSEARRFRPGDRVYYAGAINRAGSNATLQAVDERIVGRMPKTLDFAAAAALPLTAITAWEALFDRLTIDRPVPGSAPAILIIGGAGGVGSMAVQLARHRSNLAVIATASRPETRDWVQKLGAHHVIDHHRPLKPQIEALGLGAPGLVLSTQHTETNLAQIVDLLAPQGRLALIDDPKVLDITSLKSKSLSVHWELMFTRSVHGTADIDEQGRSLDAVADMIEAGVLMSTMTRNFGPLTPETLRLAHAEIEAGATIGKLVLDGVGG